jgi:hypothetical protein
MRVLSTETGEHATAAGDQCDSEGSDRRTLVAAS